MQKSILKKDTLSNILHIILLGLLHIGLVNCSISQSNMIDSELNSNKIIDPIGLANSSGGIRDTSNIQPATPKGLICFDFDKTITENHVSSTIRTHSKLLRDQVIRAGRGVVALHQDKKILMPNYDKQNPVQKEIQEDYKPNKLVISQVEEWLDNNLITLRDPENLKAMLDRFIEQGWKVAITSFTSYPEGIIAVLKRLGFSPDEIKNIPIVAGLSKVRPIYKSEHITKAMELTGVKEKAPVILVDDDYANIKGARFNGVVGIYVDDSFSWKSVEDKANSLSSLQ